METSGPGVLIPHSEDGVPLVDMQVVGEVLKRFPGLRMSFAEFLTLDEDFTGDWIDGHVELRGGQDCLHHEALSLLSIAFRWFSEKGEGRRGRALRGFLMRPEPERPARVVDMLYVAAEHAGRMKHVFVDGPADIVLEVVDDESRHRDTVEKFGEFERGGVREYWVVDPPRREARVYRLKDGRYEPMPAGDPPALRSEVLEGFWILPEWIWEDRDNFEIAREWGLI